MVLAVWIVVIVGLSPFSSKLTGAEKNDANQYLPASAESTKVFNETKAFIGDSMPTSIVYQRTAGITDADRTKVAADVRRIETEVPGLRSPSPKITESGDGQALLVNLDVPANSNSNKVIDELKAIRRVVTTGNSGMQAKVAGAGGDALDSSSAFKGIDSNLLFAAALVVALILLVTYRSPILWLIPLHRGRDSDISTQGLLYLLAKHAGLTVSGETQGVLTVLVFGAGTDYALLLTARYREELHRHADRHQAMAVALPSGRPGGAGVRCDGGREPPMPAGRKLELRPRLGPRLRHRRDRRFGGPAHPPARAAGGVRALGLLAAFPASTLSVGRRPRCGAASAAPSPAAPGALGPSPAVPSSCSPSGWCKFIP